jgi:hypothetical protein
VQSIGAVSFFDVRTWNLERGFVVLSTVVPMFFKAGFLLGVGLQGGPSSKKRV